MNRAAWRRMGRGKRIAVVVIGLGLGINLALAGLRSVIGGGEPGGPTSSSFTTSGDGFAGWADLLARRGHPVTRLHTDLSATTLSPTTTLVLADPDTLRDADIRRVAGFLDRGGRIVLAGAAATPVLDAVSGQPVRWADNGASDARSVLPPTRSGGAGVVEASGRGRYLAVGGLLPVLVHDRRILAVVGPAGRGWLVALADSGVLQNRRLGKADNAAWALSVVGTAGRPVVFAESVHGFGESTGLGALPASWRWTGAGLGLAVLIMIWAFGQRFGPVETDRRPMRPPRREYVDAMAADLARIKPPPAEVAGTMMADARRRLTDWLGLPVDADAASVRGRAAGAGLDPADVEPVLDPPRSDDDVLAAGRAAAHLRRITDRAPVPQGGHR